MVAPPVLAAVVTVTVAQPAASAGSFLATNSAEGTATATQVTVANSATGGTGFTAINFGSGATFAFDTHPGGAWHHRVQGGYGRESRTRMRRGRHPRRCRRRHGSGCTCTSPRIRRAAFRLVTYLRGATRCAYVQLGTAGQLQFIDYNVTTMCQTAASVPLNAWFRAEGYLIGDPAAGQAELKLYTTLDSVTPVETDTSTGVQNTVGTPSAFSFGPFGAASIGPYWLDDLGVSTRGYLGPPGAAIISPATLAVTTAAGAPVVECDVLAAPATLTASTAVAGPSVTGNSATIAAATVTATGLVLAPTVIAEVDQILTPATLTATVTVPQAVARGNTAFPAIVTATGGFPQPSAGGYLATSTAEGGTTGTTITAANTGGTSGLAFSAVNIGSGATLAFDNTRAAHGTLSYKVATVAAANAYATWTAPAAMPPQAWFRMYLYVTANPVSAFRLLTYLSGAVRCAYLQLGTTGQLQFIDHSAAVMCQTTAAVPLSAWFRVEGYLTGDPAAGQAELQLFTVPDGVLPAEVDTSTGVQNTVGTANGFALGPFTAASIGPYWIDDLGVSTGGYLGPTVPVANPPVVAAAAGFPQPTVTVTTPNVLAAPAAVTASGRVHGAAG